MHRFSRAAAPHEKSGKISRLICAHGSLFLVLAVYIFVVGQCPIRWFFGVPCPGCGLTRAHLAALRLDFAAAFAYHPLFFTVIPAALYGFHKDVWHISLGKRVNRCLLIVFIAAFGLVYIVRLAATPSEVIRAGFEDAVLYKILLFFRRVFSW